MRWLLLLPLVAAVIVDHCEDGLLEDFINTFHFFAAALHVSCTHLLSYCLALFGCDGSKSLGFEEIDACSLGAEIRLQANEDEWCVWTEMEDFRVPLQGLLEIISSFEGLFQKYLLCP